MFQSLVQIYILFFKRKGIHINGVLTEKDSVLIKLKNLYWQYIFNAITCIKTRYLKHSLLEMKPSDS